MCFVTLGHPQTQASITYIQMFVLVSCKQMLLLEHIIAFITFPFGNYVMLYMSCQVLRPLECLFAGAMEMLVHPRLIINVCVLTQSTIKRSFSDTTHI